MRLTLLVFGCLFAAAAEVHADKVVLVAGGGDGDNGSDATRARVNRPFGVDLDRAGNIYIVEYQGHRIRKVDAKTGAISTLAGTGEKGDAGDNGPATRARFNQLHAVIIHPSTGDLYVADTMNHKLRKIDISTGEISTIAGTGEKGYSGDDGPATRAAFDQLYCIAWDAAAENIYIADLGNRRVRKVNLKSNVVTTVAGNGKRGVPEDGADARTSPLVDPRAVAVDPKGNVYILERSGHALRVVNPEGKIRTVAGTGAKGFSGDGGPALEATMNGPKHLIVDRDGSVLIADTENHVIRRYLPESGKIVRVAGTGKKGAAGVGGPADKVELNQPHGVLVDSKGNLYISDSTNDRVLRIEK